MEIVGENISDIAHFTVEKYALCSATRVGPAAARECVRLIKQPGRMRTEVRMAGRR